jgi:hypothetical protein
VFWGVSRGVRSGGDGAQAHSLETSKSGAQELDEEVTTILVILVVCIGNRCHPHWRLQLQRSALSLSSALAAAAAAVDVVVHVVVVHVGSCSCCRRCPRRCRPRWQLQLLSSFGLAAAEE